MDVHAHYFPERFVKSINEQGGPPGVSFDLSNPDAPIFNIGGGRIPIDVTYWDLEKRVARMDAQGVTTHALSLTTPFVYWATPERGAELARIVNDSMIEAHAAYPTRFFGCATLPIQAPELAVKELDRLAKSPAIRGAYLPTSFAGKELSDPSLFPIYAQVRGTQPAGAAAPGSSCCGHGRQSSAALLPREHSGNPVRHRYRRVLPRVRRGDGSFPAPGNRASARWGRHALYFRATATWGECAPELKGAAERPFTEDLRRFHYDTITHSPQLLRDLIDLVGVDRECWAATIASTGKSVPGRSSTG